MDCIVLDWISWGDNQWGQKSYDEKRFPAPKEMIWTLHNEHVRFMISLWPTMAVQTEDHREFAEQGLFLPASDIYNAFHKEAREIYWKQLERKHFAYGTDAWWCDSSEPITPEWNHVERPEPSRLYEEYCSEAGLRLPYEYCNAFPLYHAMGIYENQRECMNRKKATAADYREKRVCNLTRSAYTGQQRYDHVVGRHRGELGNASGTGHGRASFLRKRTSVLDNGYRSIFRKIRCSVVLGRQI